MKILILAPHTDDGEFGCGATIAKLIEEGNEVYYAAFSACKQSVSQEFPENILEVEVREATRHLGVKPDSLFLFDYEVRQFNFHRQEILDDILCLRKIISPDIVFMPSPKDLHQDHNTIAREGIRAFKNTSILAYEVPWNNLTFHTTAFQKFEERHLEKKIEAIAKYRSQRERVYSSPDFIKSLAVTRGVQINAKYAEVFEVIRWVL